MNQKPTKTAILDKIAQLYGQKDQDFSLPELNDALARIDKRVAERTLRRWLAQWVDERVISKAGQKRGTRYQLLPSHASNNKTQLKFLRHIDESKRKVILAQLRDLWTHGSTALEGNTLSLGDTHSILELGLTISGKPLREHQEVVGHAKAIDLLYQLCVGHHSRPLTKQVMFDLHKAVQLEVVMDIYEPVGKWKVEKNYANSMTSNGEAVIIDYAAPNEVDSLMMQFIHLINDSNSESITLNNAPDIFAKLHLAFVHIHPFADGNGRLARLIANLPLLNAGLPPLLINQNKRREYITLLADYQTSISAPSLASVAEYGFWPDEKHVRPFAEFCRECYQTTVALLSEDSR